MMKVQGYGYEDDRFDDTSDLHYFFYEWDGETAGEPCPKFDRRGVVSSWDMVFQSISDNPAGYEGPAGDQSEPVQVFGDFEGFLIVHDEDASSGEGNFSGFAYVVDLQNGLLADYKMLNNPNSDTSGDFSDPSIAKTIADLAWWPQDVIRTEWLVLAVGQYMTEGSSEGVPSQSIAWDGTVEIRHCNDPKASPGCGYLDPFGGQQAAYDNDESLVSGFSPEKVVCMGWVKPSDLLGSNQLGFTVNGGWTRVNYVPVPYVKDGPINASGAMTYRQDESTALGFPIYTFVPEAAGTMTANEPY
jgi:hypothetical protein